MTYKSDYSGKLFISGTDITDVIVSNVPAMPTKTSQLTNNSNLTTSTGSAASATNVSKATTITAASGVSAGSKGPSANVTIKAGTGSISIPRITVNAKGLVTAVSTATFKLTTY